VDDAEEAVPGDAAVAPDDAAAEPGDAAVAPDDAAAEPGGAVADADDRAETPRRQPVWTWPEPLPKIKTKTS
jgi:hypothetical protein